ncbi:MAG: hypothetical protein DRN15_10780 [Thermoprotei archaeon]|nr:MAG: hypothetical protein DRN15_10780 [Thermoprotei archaeon]
MHLDVDPVKFLSERRFTVLFSGGKDSLAALLWICDNIPHRDWNVVYVEVTGNTHPACNEYVHKVISMLGLEERFVHAKREDLDFFEGVKKWGIPLIGQMRWCLYQFKIKVWDKHSHLTQVTGIKRSDSNRRSKAHLIEYMRLGKSVVVNPILTWKTGDVLDYIREHGIPINPCYEMYRHSGNCMFCPYHSKRKIALTLQDPYWREKIIGALRCVKAPRSESMRRILRLWLKHDGQMPLTAFMQEK